MDYTFKPKGVCSTQINFSVDENDTITKLEFVGGCAGNASGISRLAVGRSAKEIADQLAGVTCGSNTTSCPAQLSIALKEALASRE